MAEALHPPARLARAAFVGLLALLLLVVAAAFGAAALRREPRWQLVDASWTQGLSSKPGPRYKKITEGNCAGAGMAPIKDLVHCNSAAVELRLPDTTALPTDFPGIPEGCYFFRDLKQKRQGLWFGANVSNKGKGAETSNITAGKIRTPLCTSPAAVPAAAKPSTKQATDPGHGHHPPPSPLAVSQAPAKKLMKGICYAPVPFKGHRLLEDDDFMSHGTRALWGQPGRGDLATIRSLGANCVRLYGNDPALDHTSFLGEAQAQGLEVIVGMSDYPYIQMPDNCAATGFDCYAQIKAQYGDNLRGGFVVNKRYHPALRTVIIMNEPDLKFQPITAPQHFCKAMVSAFDAMLDAEKEAKVEGPRPNFTVTFSFAVCAQCHQFADKAAMGHMAELRYAMQHPESLGYRARNDMWAAYKTRFVNSVNTANPAADLRPLFLDAYDANFQGTPVFIGEYHAPSLPDLQKDLEDVLRIAADRSTLLTGISFFEFQVRYDKGGTEMMFGMFGLGDAAVGALHVKGTNFTARCITPMRPPLEVKGDTSRRQCSFIEHGVDYQLDYAAVSDWAKTLPGIPAPEVCCRRCRDAKRCRSWTWTPAKAVPPRAGPPRAGLRPGAAGGLCQLHSGQPAKKLPRPGAVSGFPPPRNIPWKEGPADESTKGIHKLGPLVSTAVTNAFGGPGLDYKKLCPASAIWYFLDA